MRRARTCYDHLAGRLGVGLLAALERDGIVVAADGSYRITERGVERLAALGIDVRALERGSRRPVVRGCRDWTESRDHLAGAVGAALARRFFELGWARAGDAGRAVELTPAGAAAVADEFGFRLDA